MTCPPVLCVSSSRPRAHSPRTVLATALKRSQSNIKEVQAKMQAQQELHVQQCRRSAVEKSKMLRLTKLQRRVAEHSSRCMQQRVHCLRAGERPINPPTPLPRWRDGVAQRCDGRAQTRRLRPTSCAHSRAKTKTRSRWGLHRWQRSLDLTRLLRAGARAAAEHGGCCGASAWAMALRARALAVT